LFTYRNIVAFIIPGYHFHHTLSIDTVDNVDIVWTQLSREIEGREGGREIRECGWEGEEEEEELVITRYVAMACILFQTKTSEEEKGERGELPPYIWKREDIITSPS
jgi:hypothetical protein